MTRYPYGPAALVILLIGLISGPAIYWMAHQQPDQRPEIIFATFSKDHAEAFPPAIKEFEKENNCRVQVQVVGQRALNSRLQAALQVGADVPDMVELLNGTMGTFTAGPLKDIQFVDLTDRMKREGLTERLVPSRLTIWSSRDRVFALPMDVHPVMLAYRQDTVEKLGIDVSKLTTWEEFVRVGRKISSKKGSDGGIENYMIDLPPDGGDFARVVLLQAGGGFFNEKSEVIFDSPVARDVLTWYVRQTQKPGGGGDSTRIATGAGWGQSLAQHMIEERVVFVICPDWRTHQMELEEPMLAGKMRVMPLPQWRPGGISTSTWGGTGMAFPKTGRNFELAWKLAMKLYYNSNELEQRFRATNILPPVRDAWNLPEYDRPREFWGGQKIGRLYAELAPKAPPEYFTSFTPLAIAKYGEAMSNTATFYKTHGESRKRTDGTVETMEDFAAIELKRCADDVRGKIARNVFLNDGVAKPSVSAVGGGEVR